jgi:DNA-binding IclR family transcriptional regulator
MHSPIDQIIECLKDGKWRTLQEISRATQLPEFKIQIAADFLADYSFLELDRSAKTARLSTAFLAFFKKTRGL